MKRAIPAVILLFFLMIAGCASGGKTNTIKVGWFGALTGDQVSQDENEFNTIKMMFESYNAAGGIALGDRNYNLEVVGYDSKGNAQESVNIAKRLTGQDKVVAILGPGISANAIPIAPVLEQAKVPDIATMATDPKVTVLDGKVKAYNFRVCFIDSYQGTVAAGYAFDTLGMRKAAILHEFSDDYSQGLRESFTLDFEKKGGMVVADESFNNGEVNFKAQLSAIKAANPDLIFMPSSPKAAILIASQARGLGLRQVLIGGDRWLSDQLLASGGKPLEGSYFVSQLDPSDPAVQDFKALYAAKYGKEPAPNGYLVHDAVILLVAGLRKAGKANGEALAKALSGIEVQGITGKILISPESHNPEGKDAAIVKIAAGRYVFQEKYASR